LSNLSSPDATPCVAHLPCSPPVAPPPGPLLPSLHLRAWCPARPRSPVPVRRRTQADRAVAFAASPVSSRCPSTFTVSLCFRLSASSSFSYQIGLNRRLDALPSRAHVLRLPARVGGSEVERESKAGCQGQPVFSITTQNSAMGSGEDKAAAAILALYYCGLKLVDSMP
jgi:hypothetical protein